MQHTSANNRILLTVITATEEIPPKTFSNILFN
jgi:hypothetical protein